MATVIVLTFDNPDEAGRLRQTLRELERRGTSSWTTPPWW